MYHALGLKELIVLDKTLWPVETRFRPGGPVAADTWGVSAVAGHGLARAMQEARRRADAVIRPGTPCAEVDLASKRFLHDEGSGPCLLHRTGHGLVLGNREAPWVAEGSTEMLAENMLISVEPGIYLPGLGGAR